DRMDDAGSAVVALRSALRLGSDRRSPLERLLAIYRRLEAKDEAVPLLLELAEIYENSKEVDLAAVAVRDAQELGADATACARLRARLAMAEGDMEQAVIQLELVARGTQAQGLHQEAADAFKQLLDVMPARGEYALARAESLAALGNKDETIKTLRAALEHQQVDDLQVALYEMIAKVNPGDFQAHDWLAKAYQKHKNRDGATEQLKLVASAQDKSGDHAALASTLEQILQLGGEQIVVLKRLALVYSRLGQEGKASATLVRAVDSALAAGHLDEARDMCEVAVELDPSNLLLRIRMAHVSHRQGHADVAELHFRAAARIARGVGKPEVAQKMIVYLRNLRPDDLLVRIEHAELAIELADPTLDDALRDLVHFAARTENFGIALGYAKKRVELAGKDAYHARTELVELMRRMGDTAGELKAGKELLDDLLERGDFEHAVELLKRLVASNSRNSDLVLHLAELIGGLGDQRQSQRFYRHAVTLLQLEGRIDEANKILDLLEHVGEDSETVRIAREHLGKGQALEWDAIKFSLSHRDAKKIAQDIVSMSGAHPVVPTST
ncbi:MAG: hypothetical protein H0X45_12095, partial [Planctomycetes bacterium]|nr:hypothetical protein [Planctomycetota bacterium]